MQLFSERTIVGQTVVDGFGDNPSQVVSPAQTVELDQAVAVTAAANRAPELKIETEALTPLPRGRSLVPLSYADPTRLRVLDLNSDVSSAATLHVVDPLDVTVASASRLRPRLEFVDLSTADEARLFPKVFRHNMLWLDIWGLPLPFLAFALNHRADVDPTCPDVRDAIDRVNCPEGGTWGKSAQSLLQPTISAFGPEKKPKRKSGRRERQREPDWSTSNPFVWLVLLEEAANCYAAGTFTPSDNT